MRRLGLLLVVLIVVVPLLFATCRTRTDEMRRANAAREAAEAVEARAAAQRRRIEAPAETPTPPEAPHVEPLRPGVEPKIELENYEGVVAAPNRLVRGRVVDPHGAPIAGLRVGLQCAWLPDDVLDGFVNSSPQAHAESETADDGRFELPYFDGGRRELRVYDAEGNLRWHARDVDAAKEREIVLDERGATVVVRTSAADHAPVVPLHVELQAMPLEDEPALIDEILAEVVCPDCTAENRFDNVAAGPALLEVKADGFAPIRTTVTIDGRGEQTIYVTMDAGRTLRGRVVDARTGDGLHDGGVTADYFAWLYASTRPDGAFALDHLPSKPGERMRFRGWASGHAESVFFADTAADVLVKLYASATFRVRCLDEENAPLRHAVVAVSSDYVPLGATMTATSVCSDRTDAAGRAELTDLHACDEGRDLRVRYFRDGVLVLERAYPPLSAGETRDVGDVTLPRPK